jgi:hypothetical protein
VVVLASPIRNPHLEGSGRQNLAPRLGESQPPSAWSPRERATIRFAFYQLALCELWVLTFFEDVQIFGGSDSLVISIFSLISLKSLIVGLDQFVSTVF